MITLISIIILVLSILLTPLFVYIFDIFKVKYIWLIILIFIGLYIVLLALYFVFLFIVSLFINKKKVYTKQNKFNHFLTIQTMQLLLQMFRAHVKTSGLEMVPHDQKYLLVYNHTSNFDPIIQSYVLRKDNVIHISKPSNFDIPIGGPISYRDCYIPINRENDREALKTIIFASKFISNQEFSVSVSPEGTRNKGDVNKLLPFRDGCFRLALYAKCPIVVCELYKARDIAKNAPWKRTNVEMNVLKVLTYDEIKDKKTSEIGSIVNNLLQDKINSRLEK